MGSSPAKLQSPQEEAVFPWTTHRTAGREALEVPGWKRVAGLSIITAHHCYPSFSLCPESGFWDPSLTLEKLAEKCIVTQGPL